MRAHERTIILKTLEVNKGNRRRSAEVLGITQRALEKILERHHLVKHRYSQVLPIPPASFSKETDEKKSQGKDEIK